MAIQKSSTHDIIKTLFDDLFNVPKKDKEKKTICRLAIINAYAAHAKNQVSEPAGNLSRYLQGLEVAMAALANTPTKTAFEYSTSISGTASELRNQVSDRDARVEQLKNAIMNLNKDKRFKNIVDAISGENTPPATILGMIDALGKTVQEIVGKIDALSKSTETLDKKLKELSDSATRNAENITQTRLTKPVTPTETGGAAPRTAQ